MGAPCGAHKVFEVKPRLRVQAIARPMYSNPPLHGALLVKEILGEDGLKQRCAGNFNSACTCTQGMPATLGL